MKLFVHLGSAMERFTAKLRVSDYFECFESRIFAAELNVLMYTPLTATAIGISNTQLVQWQHCSLSPPRDQHVPVLTKFS